MKNYLKYFSLIALMLLVATPAVAAEFNWHVEEKKLLELYQKIAG